MKTEPSYTFFNKTQGPTRVWVRFGEPWKVGTAEGLAGHKEESTTWVLELTGDLC